ncbi:sigma-70 family RNA polymerase sigma factor [Archangium violaceum]|uniref:sigma-70 family RNA polymerase sigma factor n=1 Tax=Archangium violaceum TaxID=83451 RepID=UPI002B2884F6|nr:sigma-70 family RNA polymerase sigma factor [Archangium violaceum]
MATAYHLEEHRAALTGHCYRMLGSAAEADDAVQETLVRAWRNLDRFEERASLRTWLYRIATRVCLDSLDERSRRARPMELGPVGSVDGPLDMLPGSRWIEPIPDAQALPSDADPSELLILRQSIRLAFVAALQHLPPKQRAVLLLTEVLGWSAAEVAESLETSVASVNSALQRARATLATRDLSQARAPLSDAQSSLLDRYVSAFERYDMDAFTQLLHQDATISMPPYALWLRGHESIRAWMLGRGSGCRGSRLVPTSACGSPAFGQYRPGEAGGPHKPWALIILEISGDRIAAMNSFLDTEVLFPRFGLPSELAS